MFRAFKLFGTTSDVDQLEQRVEELMQELERRDDDLRKANHQTEQLKKEQNVRLAKNNHSTSSQLETRRQIKRLEETKASLEGQRDELLLQRDLALAQARSLQEDTKFANDTIRRVENRQMQSTRYQVSTSSHVEQCTPKPREKEGSKQIERLGKTREVTVASLTDELQKKREQIDNLKVLLDREKTDHEGARALLASKIEELHGMRPFLMTADDVPLAEVLTLVEDLNSEVFTMAAAIADWVNSEGLCAKGNSSVGKDESRSRVAESLGENMVRLLASNGPCMAEEDIALACQAGLLTLCQTLVECWISPGDQGETLLASIYDNMQSAANQNVAGRWRSLTAKHVGKDGVGIETTDITLGAIPLLEAILIVAGCNEDDASATVRKFNEQLTAVGRVVTKTRKAIRVDVISSDLYLVCIPHGIAFDSTEMENEDRSEAVEGVVFCTTALGLQETVKSEQGGGENQRKMPLRPKVTLMSSIF